MGLTGWLLVLCYLGGAVGWGMLLVVFYNSHRWPRGPGYVLLGALLWPFLWLGVIHGASRDAALILAKYLRRLRR